jgi:hypothetical protein
MRFKKKSTSYSRWAMIGMLAFNIYLSFLVFRGHQQAVSAQTTPLRNRVKSIGHNQEQRSKGQDGGMDKSLRTHKNKQDNVVPTVIAVPTGVEQPRISIPNNDKMRIVAATGYNKQSELLAHQSVSSPLSPKQRGEGLLRTDAKHIKDKALPLSFEFQTSIARAQSQTGANKDTIAKKVFEDYTAWHSSVLRRIEAG